MAIHPEGKRYSYNTAEDGISVVTEANIADASVAEQLETYLATLRDLAAKENVHLPATTDIFLEVDQDMETCSYWFADHAQRTVFWAHEVETVTAGLPDSHSTRHLREPTGVFSSFCRLISFIRVLPGGKLLGTCGNVPCHRIAIFSHCLERTYSHSFERSRR